MAQNMYQKPVFINSVNHKFVKVAPVSHYKFAGGLNSTLIVGPEFREAAKFYPLVFTKDAEGEIVPIAVLGLRNDENLFVAEDGKWLDATYIPAYFRRYPFILSRNPDQGNSFAVCVDSDYEGLGTENGMPLFDAEGNQTEEFKKTVEFLRNYQIQFDNTKRLIKMLDDYKLFKQVSANVTLPAGEKIGLGGWLMVDEEALMKLEDEKVMTLFRPGFLSLIYAHLYSMSNFRSLITLLDKKQGAKG